MLHMTRMLWGIQAGVLLVAWVQAMMLPPSVLPTLLPTVKKGGA